MKVFDNEEEKPINNHLFEDGGFGQNIKAMRVAEKAFIEEQTNQRIQRAEAMGRRKTQHFLPGDLVFYWRTQQAGKSHQKSPKGKFLGPARVHATKSRRESTGKIRPGAVAWLGCASRLLRAAPEQLRGTRGARGERQGASGASLDRHQPGDRPKRRTYFDISNDIPPEQAWQDGTEDLQLKDEEEELPHITRGTQPRKEPRRPEPRGFKRPSHEPAGE